MFYNCSSLTSLPDLSKWNIKNVKSIGGIFFNCSKLTSLPNISKWDISNVKNMNLMFCKCSSLSKLFQNGTLVIVKI